MGFSYHYTFSAPAATPAADLEKFLRTVEVEAKVMGFRPTFVLNAEFVIEEQKQFARRLTTSYWVEDKKLKGVTLLDERQVWDYHPVHGSCRLIPQRGVVLIVTDEGGCEAVFGFLAYPKELRDVNQRVLLTTPCSDRWLSRDFVDRPDPRYRKIVRRFAEAGFLESEKHEFA